MNELEKKLYEVPELKAWEVKDLDSADWAIGKIKSIEEDYQEKLSLIHI